MLLGARVLDAHGEPGENTGGVNAYPAKPRPGSEVYFRLTGYPPQITNASTKSLQSSPSGQILRAFFYSLAFYLSGRDHFPPYFYYFSFLAINLVFYNNCAYDEIVLGVNHVDDTVSPSFVTVQFQEFIASREKYGHK
ncbi:hypothetical protein [Paenibacillus chitinolyticus]|uniref:hypothetical protein n=1 Tax=Paenibacillus chitinolyticus TaxID=79263 RepID=UPI0035DCE803